MANGILARFTKWALIAFIALGSVFIVFEAATWFHPPLLALGLGMLDRKPLCGSIEAFRGVEVHEKTIKVADQIRRSARKIESDPGGYSLWETPMGRYWTPKASDDVLPAILAQQEVGIYASTENRVKPGDIVLDCGAHVGTYARRALDAGAKLVIAIEPSPANVESLNRNFKTEIAEGRLVVSPVGVWDKNDVLPLYQDPANSAADSFVIRGPRDIVVNIPLTTIDRIVADLKLARVDVIKMDIKGATRRALNGGSGIIAAYKPRIVISSEENEDDPVQISRDLARFGYKVACGACAVSPSFEIHPEVLFFQ